MPGSTYGNLFKISTFGESHGQAVGVVIDGAPPGLPITEEEIQKELDRRKPGQSDYTTPRQEPDKIHILSGIFEGKLTGTPVLMILYNKDAQSSAYSDIKDLFRPGHADYTYLKKYGIRDHRGSGRASGRETAARVAAGAVAKKILLNRGIDIFAYTKNLGGIEAQNIDKDFIEKNMVRTADTKVVEQMYKVIEQAKENHDSVGGIVECRINGVSAGIGEPVFDKLDSELAKSMLSIGATKGIEFGAGFNVASMKGSENNDPMNSEGFLTNNAGGIIGGISTGEEIVFRIAVKPTSSIASTQKTVNINFEETDIKTEGRHDPCICPRIIPVVEAMAAITLYDLIKRQESLVGESL